MIDLAPTKYEAKRKMPEMPEVSMNLKSWWARRRSM